MPQTLILPFFVIEAVLSLEVVSKVDRDIGPTKWTVAWDVVIVHIVFDFVFRITFITNGIKNHNTSQPPAVHAKSCTEEVMSCFS